METRTDEDRLDWSVDSLNTRTLLPCSLKDPAFHIRTVYVNSLDPNMI